MNKGLKILLFALLDLAVIVVGFIVIVSTAKIPVYEVDFPDLEIECTPERVAEERAVRTALDAQVYSSFRRGPIQCDCLSAV